MFKRLITRSVVIATLSFLLVSVPALIVGVHSQTVMNMSSPPTLLSDPFLQLPTKNSVRVVWFTDFAGVSNTVVYGKGLNQTAVANTIKLSRTREDHKSRVGQQSQDGQVYQKVTTRDIWRHEAEVMGLTLGVRVPYRVTSVREDNQRVSSKEFTLAANPTIGTPLKILLTSDHQLKSMVAANLQKVTEKIGQVDAVFMAGDLINISDRASEWFDDNRGGAFFPALQGRANYAIDKNGTKTIYAGSEIIQNAPLFTAIGNHEVMGRFSMDSGLDSQIGDAIPLQAAKNLADNQQRKDEKWLKDNSFNTDTYEKIFSLPQNSPGNKKYYAVTFGDVRLVVLYATNVWRFWGTEPDTKGKFSEKQQDLNNPKQWGYGQHIFEPISKGSKQYNWLNKELNSTEFKQAKYKVVMLHHPLHSLGENSVPAYTDPKAVIERASDGSITSVKYEYPQEADYLIRDVLPLLERARVQLVYYGHSHLWNRFISPQKMNFLESSNVGNSYGAFMNGKQRLVPRELNSLYAATGNPNGLPPIVPTIAPLIGEDNKPLPYISSNDLTVFSILDTGIGTVSSYYFDTREPKSQVIKFDEFKIRE